MITYRTLGDGVSVSTGEDDVALVTNLGGGNNVAGKPVFGDSVDLESGGNGVTSSDVCSQAIAIGTRDGSNGDVGPDLA